MSVVYLDDILIMGRSLIECQENIRISSLLIQKLGFIINFQKCQLIPSQRCKYLGFWFNSEKMLIELPNDKQEKVKQLTQKFQKMNSCKIRELARFIGTVVACCPAVPYGFAHTKIFERARYLALRKNNNCFDSNMIITLELKKDFYWWEKINEKSQNSIRSPKFRLEIRSDASRSGWGAICENKRSHGFWNTRERESHINFLELTAAFFALKCFATQLQKCDILLRMDNTTAIAYINRMGGTRVKNLSNLSRSIWDWCEDRNLNIVASFIGTKENVEADFESRRLEKGTEYALADWAFRKITDTMGIPDVDLFASRTNTKCDNYVSWYCDPGCMAVDAFTISWTNFTLGYAFPPYSIIQKVLRKIEDDQATVVVVAPRWPTQPWYPLFRALMSKGPITLKPSKNLLLSSDRQPHPLWKDLTLEVGKLSGKPFN